MVGLRTLYKFLDILYQIIGLVFRLDKFDDEFILLQGSDVNVEHKHGLAIE